MMNRILTMTACLLAMLAMASCGGGGNTGLNPGVVPAGTYPEKPTLSIAEGSLINEPSAVQLRLAEDASGIRATLELEADSGLSTLYTEIAYDPARFSLVSIELTDELGDRQLLALGLNAEPGLVQSGHVLPNFDRVDALDSGGVLATLHFSRGAEAGARRTAMVPRGLQARAPMTAVAGPMFSGTDALISTVQYTNPGDYDQNGVVTIADLTPLGLHFGQTGPFGDDLLFIGIENFPVETVVDGDGNGEINLADLTVIGQNFGNDALGGYNIYASSNPDDVPADAAAPSTIPAASSVPFANGVGDPVADRLIYGYIQPSAPAGPVVLWARPVDSEGNEGTVSQVVQMSGAPGPVLDLDGAALSGSGTESDPYFIDPNVNHQLMLNHAVDGNVTLDPDSQYFLIGGFSSTTGPGGGGGVVELTPLREVSAGLIGSGFVVPNVGEINQETAEMDIVDIYQGGFSVVATYRSRISNTLHFYAPDLDNLAPVAHIGADSTDGVAPWTATLSAALSNDVDGSIEQYDWDLDGDGIYEIEDGSQVQTLELGSGGYSTVRLRVTDDDLATAVATRELSTEGWLSTAIDNVSDISPADPMMATIDGNPAIAYRRFNSLYYVRAADPQGTEWNIPQAVPLSVTARHISLRALAGGIRPAMAYQRVGAEAGIYYVTGNTADATSFTQVRITSDPLDHSPSLNVIDGNPAIAYVWHTGDADDPYSIYYVRATDPVAGTGGDWDLFNGGTVWKGSEFHLDKTALTTCEANAPGTSGRPAVWYVLNNDQFNTPWRAYFSKATNNQGTNWTLLPFSLGNNTPGDQELQFAVAASITDRPYLLARNATTGGLLVRKANDLSTTDWSAPAYIPDSLSSDYGYHLASANVAGFLGLAYYSTEEQAVTYRATQTPEISDDFPVGGVVATGVGAYDTDAHESAYLSVGNALGQPLVCYHDMATAELKVARYFVP
ncbi:MAG: hypothetical protein R3F46_01305 [bacterium]